MEWLQQWQDRIPLNSLGMAHGVDIRGEMRSLVFEPHPPSSQRKIDAVHEHIVCPIWIYDARPFWGDVSLVPGKFMDPRGWIFTWANPHPEMLRHRGPMLWDTGEHLVEPTMFFITDKHKRDRMIGRIYPYYYTLAGDILALAGLDATYGKEAPSEFDRMAYYADMEELRTY